MRPFEACSPIATASTATSALSEKIKSRLVPVGFGLMLVGITFPRALSTVASNLDPGPGRVVP